MIAAIPAAYLPFAAGVLVFAGFVKGAVGFGITLITVPLLSMVLPPQKAIFLMILPVLLMNLISAAITVGQWRELRRILWLAPAGVLFVPLGVRLLLWIPPDIMRGAIAVSLLVLVAMRYSGWSAARMTVRRQRLFSVGAGALSGFLGGAIMLPMAPLVFFLNASAVPREAFVFLVNAFASLLLMGQLLSFAWMDETASSGWTTGLALIAPCLLGLAFGTRLRQRFSQAFFERLVLAILALSAVSLLARLGARYL